MKNNVKENNNNKGVIILLCMIIVILLALCTLFATGTINLSNKQTRNEQTNNGTSTQIEENNINNTDNTTAFGGEYVYNLTNGAKVYTDYNEDGSFYYKRIEADNSVSTYGYGIYALNGNNLVNKIVFGIDTDNKSIVKSATPESKYIIKDNTIEYDASGTSGQNHIEEKVSNEMNISKEVTSYLYSISKNNEYKSNFAYE